MAQAARSCAAGVYMTPTIAQITATASALTGVSIKDIRGPIRKRSMVHIRAAISIVARSYDERGNYRRYSYPAIGRYLGGRDHSSIIHIVENQDVYERRAPGFPEFLKTLQTICDGKIGPHQPHPEFTDEAALAFGPVNIQKCPPPRAVDLTAWVPKPKVAAVKKQAQHEPDDNLTDDQLLTARVQAHYAAGGDCLEVWR
jgi:hypothetical protein